MADTEIETDLSVKLNGNVCTNTERHKKSSEELKTNKMIDKSDKNTDSNLNCDKRHVESGISLSNHSNDGEDVYCEIDDDENDSEDENHINNKDCKSDDDDDIIEDDQTVDSEHATINSDELCDTGNSCNGTKENASNDSEEQMEIDTIEDQKVDDEQMDVENYEEKEDRINDQNDTESRSNEIKKSLEDSRISLDKSVTIVKVPDPKQSPGSSGKKKVKSLPDITLTPRRSTRNLNKLKSFNEKDEEKKEIVTDDVKISSLKTTMVTKPIVVNDTKKLVEIAAGTKQKSNKKEPTLVIIDTNMLSGRSNLPLAVSVQSNTHNNAMSVTQTTSKTIQHSYNRVQPSQTSIKPFLLASSSNPGASPQIGVPKPPIILPTLTDDMFVVEAPSFIVPYVYEKPPKKPLKEYVEKIEDNKTIKPKIKVSKCDIDENLSEEDNELLSKNNRKEKSNNDKININESENQLTIDEKKSEGEKEKKKNKENGDDQLSLDDSDDTKSKSLSGSTDLKKSDSITDLTVDSDEKKTDVVKDKPKTQSSNYFENPLGKFFMQIGVNLVQEHVQLDLLRTQRRKRDREGDKCPEEVHIAISSLIKTLEFSKENNDPFQFGLKKCELCNFKSESSLVMAHHLETPHMTANYCYRCNFCTFQVRSPHEIINHMETHSSRGRLERGPALHQCPSCPFEDSYKGKLTRHLISCTKKYRPEINQAPPLDWEPPAKIPRVLRNKPSMSPGNAVYQAAMSGFKQFPNPNMLQLQQHQQYNKMIIASSGARGRGRTVLPGQRFSGMVPSYPTTLPNQTSGGIVLKNTSIKPINQSMIVPTPYSMNNHTYQQNSNTNKSVQQPSISITPLPRSFPSSNSQSGYVTSLSKAKSVQPTQPTPSTNSSNKPTFVICEICDGYIKDLEQLRNHMQWIHKVKIHPKMIYNRPPLNCQKCQFRFFTDQGLERHLLGSHGLVTSSMQEAANKGKDGGRCPVCGRVYQWKLLNHVNRDHSMSLKPAHLSYKCTVCTATFGMYKQFENHVYSAHSNVAKNSNKKPLGNQPIASSSSSSTSTTSTPKPLKINDEITIIPQPPKIQNLSIKSSNSNKPVTSTGKQSAVPTTAKSKV